MTKLELELRLGVTQLELEFGLDVTQLEIELRLEVTQLGLELECRLSTFYHPDKISDLGAKTRDFTPSYFYQHDSYTVFSRCSHE